MFQSAYKRFHSTETALIRVQNDLLRSPRILVLLDLSAAFDTIDHDILLLHDLGVRDSAHAWFKSCLTDRHQCVYIKGQHSHEHMNTDYISECLRDLYSVPFFFLFTLVHLVQLQVQMARNTISMLMMLSCIFHSNNLRNSLNPMHWNLLRSVPVLSRSGLQRIIWNVMAIKQNWLWSPKTIERAMRHQAYHHLFGYCNAIR